MSAVKRGVDFSSFDLPRRPSDVVAEKKALEQERKVKTSFAIPESLHKEVRAMCFLEGVEMQDLITRLLRHELAEWNQRRASGKSVEPAAVPRSEGGA